MREAMAKSMILISFIVTGHALSGQSVILINGEAHQVNLKGQEVTKVTGPVKGHMEGYSSKQDNFQKASLNNTQPNQSIPDRGQVAAAASKKVVTTTVTSSDKIKTGNNLIFKPGSSELDNKAKRQLKLNAADIVTKISKSVLLETSYLRSDKESERLAKDRLEACKAFLEKNGVRSNVIISNSRRADAVANGVSIILR